MRDINANNNSGIFNITENHYYNNNQKSCDVTYQTKETKTADLIKNKLKDFIISLVSALISIFINLIDKNIELEAKTSTIIMIAILCLYIFSFIFLICFILDIIQIFKLKKTGQCVHFQSKLNILRSFKETNDNQSKNTIGALYKNEGGKIYKIEGCKCPYCKDSPIGKMRPKYVDKQKRYCFECDQNPNHKRYFDYKTKVK